MAISLYQDLWNGKETLSETVALRCGEKQLTFGDFFQNILRAEAGLRSLGGGPGDLVTLITLNTPEAVIAFYAIDRIGAVANWVDTKLSPTEVEEYLIRAQSKVVLVLELPRCIKTAARLRRNILLRCRWPAIFRMLWGKSFI